MGALHLGPQVLQGAELKLLYGPLAAPELPRNFTNTPLLDEALEDDAALVVGELAHQTKKAGTIFNCFQVRLGAGLGRILGIDPRNLSSGALGLIGHGVGGNSYQPGGERSAAPFIVPQVGESSMENVGGQVFGRVAIAYPPGNKPIDPFKMHFIEIAKLPRV